MEHLIVPQHFPYVGTGFSNARNSVIFDPMDPGVIGRQGQGKIALVEVQQMPQLLSASADILDGIVDVAHTQRGRGSRRQLHQADRAFARHGMLAKIRFGLDDSAQQGRIKTIFLGVPRDGPMDFLSRIPRVGAVVVGPRWRGNGGNQQAQHNQRTEGAQHARTERSAPCVVDGHGVRLYPGAQDNLHRGLKGLKIRAEMGLH